MREGSGEERREPIKLRSVKSSLKESHLVREGLRKKKGGKFGEVRKGIVKKGNWESSPTIVLGGFTVSDFRGRCLLGASFWIRNKRLEDRRISGSGGGEKKKIDEIYGSREGGESNLSFGTRAGGKKPAKNFLGELPRGGRRRGNRDEGVE